MSDLLLAVRGLRVRVRGPHGGAEVLRGVDVDVSRGETGHGWRSCRTRRSEAGMRYSKGTIALSQTQDLPLLRQGMYSKYVTQTQLWQFMRHSGYELSRGSFWWRVKRLEDHGFIARHSLPMAHRDPIFAIASPGLVYLVENVGTPYNGPAAGPDIRVDGAGVAHAVDAVPHAHDAPPGGELALDPRRGA